MALGHKGLHSVINRPDQALSIDAIQLFAVPMVDVGDKLLAIIATDRKIDP
jgi:hypothetical protein